MDRHDILSAAIDFIAENSDGAKERKPFIDLLNGLRQIRDEIKSDNWISSEDKLPDNDDEVLMYYNSGFGGRPLIGRLETHTNRNRVWENTDTYFKNAEITHWMPLPEKPIN